MNNDENWSRPKKPYTVVPERTNNGYSAQSSTPGNYPDKKPFKKPLPSGKSVIIPAKNNSNNRILHQIMRENLTAKISINNLLSSDSNLSSTYEGKITGFDDFTIALETGTGTFLINKSAISVLEMIKPVTPE